MTEQKNFKNLAAISLAFVLSNSSLQAGFIDLLRGEKTPVTSQRVAFVGSALVKDVQGDAEKLVGIDRWVALKNGEKLQPGDLIRTRQGGVVLRMEESGSFIKVTPNTQVRLATLEKDWDRATLTGREEQQGFAIRACRGVAHYLTADGAWQKVAVNSVIPEGTQVRLEKGTVLDLYWTTEMRAIRLEGQNEAVLSAAVFSRKGAESVAIVAR